MGALTENHQCPRSRFWQTGKVVSVLGVGGIAGMALCYTVAENPAGLLVLSSTALGAVLAYAMKLALSPHA